MNSKLKKSLFVAAFLIAFVIFILTIFPRFEGSYSKSIVETKIAFRSAAKGGTLLLGKYSIVTTEGETAESVVKRLADEIGSDKTVGNVDFGKPAREAIPDMASGNILKIPGNLGFWCLAGTETGLGIPQLPVFLSCTYNESLDKHQIRWQNPQTLTENDLIYLRWHYQLFEKQNNRGTLESNSSFSLQGLQINDAVFVPATTTSYTIDKPSNVKDYFRYMSSVSINASIMVLRFESPASAMVKKGIPPLDHPYKTCNSIDENVIPSNIASIKVIDKGMTQEDSLTNAFTGIVASNWIAWGTDEIIDKDAFGQGRDNGPCYQIINAPAENHSHGVYRKFLGLTPGHTYMITARLSTLDMYSIKSDWSFSLQAVAGNENDSELTAGQMAGTEALPDGRIGGTAAVIASFGPGKTINKNFMDFGNSEIKKYLGGAIIEPNITLPSDADEITVWWRFSCNDPKGRVGFSSIKVSDVTGKGTI